jgi:hypothetical protein
VHGFTGDRDSTWTEDESKVFWPKDLLHHDIPNARIMTFGYDADIVNILRPASSNSVRSYGQALLNDLALKRKRTKTVSETPKSMPIDVNYTVNIRINVLLYSLHTALEVLYVKKYVNPLFHRFVRS